jgi:lipoprotein-anchoring transpeptidase ErfK/SrfK
MMDRINSLLKKYLKLTDSGKLFRIPVKTTTRSLLLLVAATALTLTTSCGGGDSEKAETAPADSVTSQGAPQLKISDGDVQYDKNSSFIVISKKDLTLTVYANSKGDTIALATYPVCVGKNKGNKEGSGDMRTPESPAGEPFTITQIQDASTWAHDFGDGRGSILAYGNWFLRLKTPFSGIGIHGSTNNENSVPGRGSEGCIRLLDKDIITLKENYARVGMPVIIKGEEQGLLPFEEKCVVK